MKLLENFLGHILILKKIKNPFLNFLILIFSFPVYIFLLAVLDDYFDSSKLIRILLYGVLILVFFVFFNLFYLFFKRNSFLPKRESTIKKVLFKIFFYLLFIVGLIISYLGVVVLFGWGSDARLLGLFFGVLVILAFVFAWKISGKD